jgi:hemoglobin/transferrin/lactoferrin receptor protein
LTLQAQARFNGAKKIEDYSVSDIEANGVIDRDGTPDNLEFTPWKLDANGEVSYLGASAWTTLNLYTNIKLTKKISLDFAVENVFDKFYIPFASSIASPGRNFIITLRGKI